MSKKIKFLWDFRGPNSLKIAEHHCVHLKEYAENEKLNYYDIDVMVMSEMYAIAYLILDEKNMELAKEALKPHRGQLAK